MARAERLEVVMRGYWFVGLVALITITACVDPQQEQQQFEKSAAGTNTQSSQAQSGDFDGSWVGSGRRSPNVSRNRCGDGPLVELTIQGGTARAVFRLPVRRGRDQRPRTEVLSLNGGVDDQGKLELFGFQSEAMAVLLASDGSGEGTWETRTLVCHGTFPVRRRP